MAATKVDVRPSSSSCKAQASSGLFSQTSSCSSGLNAISSPKLNNRSFKAFSNGPSSVFSDGNSFVSSKFQRAKHFTYKASSFSRNHDLSPDFSQASATDVDAGGMKVPANDCGYTSGTGGAATPFFGLLRAVSLHPFSPLCANMGLGKIGLVNLHHCNSFPPLLFTTPLTQHRQLQKPGASVTEDLVPTLSHFEVKCSSQTHEGGRKVNGLSSPFVKGEQLCRQHFSLSVSENNSNCELCSDSKQVPGAVSSRDSSCSKEVCSGDEMPGGIHGGLKEIHADTTHVTSCECSLSDFDGCGNGLESASQSSDIKDRLLDGPAISKEPSSTKTNSEELRLTIPTILKDPPLAEQACIDNPPSTMPPKLDNGPVLDSLTEKSTSKVEHLSIDRSHCELRKLLSDESGFYDSASPTLPSEASCGLSGWWQQDSLRQEEEKEEEEAEEDEWDWEDEDECEGELCLM